MGLERDRGQRRWRAQGRASRGSASARRSTAPARWRARSRRRVTLPSRTTTSPMPAIAMAPNGKGAIAFSVLGEDVLPERRVRDASTPTAPSVRSTSRPQVSGPTTGSRATRRSSVTRREPAGATTARPSRTATRSGSPPSTSRRPAPSSSGCSRVTRSAGAPMPTIQWRLDRRSRTGRRGSRSSLRSVARSILDGGWLSGPRQGRATLGGMRAFAAAIVAASLTTAIPMSVASGSSSSSGLEGKVLRGPVSPVCVQGRPCQVVASVTLAFSRSGTRVARVRSTQAGNYRIALPPGVYTVAPAFPHPMWHVFPHTVHVPAGRYERVNLLVDTGIR